MAERVPLFVYIIYGLNGASRRAGPTSLEVGATTKGNSSGLRPRLQPLLVFYALLLDAVGFPRQGVCCVTPVSCIFFQFVSFKPSWFCYKCSPKPPLQSNVHAHMCLGLSTHITICTRPYHLALLVDSVTDGGLFLSR